MELEKLLDDFYAPLRGLSDHTIYLYRLTIREFAKSLGKQPTLADLEELAVARFLARRVRERSAGTAAKDRSQLRALWEFAARRKMCDTWPTVQLVKVAERIPEAWTTAEMNAILTEAAKEKAPVGGIEGPAYWRAIILTCYWSGERIGAVLGLQWRDISGRLIKFRAEVRKGGRRDILREVSHECIDALLAIRGARKDDDPVFPWNKGSSYIWKRLGIILARAGLPNDRRCKFHKFRRTAASYFKAAGGNATDFLDHSDPATTRVYLDPRIVRGESAVDKLPRVG